MDRSLYEELTKVVLPYGEIQRKYAIKNITALINRKLSEEEAANVYFATKTLFVTQKDRDFEHICDYTKRKAANKLSEEDVTVIIAYAMADLLKPIITDRTDRKFLLEAFGNTINTHKMGTESDCIPSGTGRFGYDRTNPIPVKGIEEEEKYLSMLRTPDGKKIVWKRFASVSADNIEGLIDAYKIMNKKFKDICMLYICPYNKKTSNKAPDGFLLTSEK